MVSKDFARNESGSDHQYSIDEYCMAIKVELASF